MMHTNTQYRLLASLVFASFLSNTLAPTIQFAFADSTQYYVDAASGSDANDGLTPGTAWQTLAHVNSQTLQQGDTISLLCGQSWSEGISSLESGSAILPITINSYGTCDSSNEPIIESIDTTGANYINISGLNIAPITGTAVTVSGSTNISISNSDITSPDATAISVTASSNVTILTNNFITGVTAITLGAGTTSTVQGNTISGLSDDAIIVHSTLANTISQNNINNIGQSAIVISQNTTVSQNSLSSICTTGGIGCAAIISNPLLSAGTSLNATLSENTLENIGNGVIGGNHGISLSGVTNVVVTANTVNNAEDAIHLVDAASITLSNNTLLFPRKNSIAIIQNTPATVAGNTMNGNTLLQRNVDYPYIEMRDEVPGAGTASLITANGNNFVTLYKPATSYVRSVKFGGETVEYNKKTDLDIFDTTNNTFQSFGYAPYTSTGNYATANLLTNPNFEADVTGWTPFADVGMTPSLSQVVGGTYSGNSLLMTPQDITPDRFGITNDAIMSITSGQVYEVSGYLRSTSTGDLSIRASLHQAGVRTVLYADRAVETYSTATGRTFRFYVTATTTAADAQFSLESTNQNISLEIDEVSFRRKTVVMKNTEANEVLVFSNTGSSSMNQGCPGGVPCAAYVDTANASIGWPGSNLTVPAYSTRVALWNNSPNLMTIPQVSMMIDSGSIPSGTEAHVSWIITGSTDSRIQYATQNSGTIMNSISDTGDVYFEPPAGTNTTTYIYTENDIGPRVNTVVVTTTNTPPVVYPVTIIGVEDAPTIIGTLSGIDYNPGDSVFFEEFTDPVIGDVSVNLSGTATYLPTPDFCGSETFSYRAYDDYNNYSDPGTATVQITCTNDAPTTAADSVTVTGAVSYFDVLANDTDPDSIYEVQSFFLSGFTQPTHGTISIVGNQFEYIVDVGYIGADSFTYSMEDQSGALSNTGTVTIDVTVPNTPPVDYAASYTTNEDIPYVGTVTGSDINPDTLTYTAATLPSNGILSLLSNGSFTYTPTANYNGIDSFIYQVFDGSAYSSGAQIDLTITSVSDAPVAVADSYSLIQDTSLTLPVIANDSDADTPLGSLVLTGYTNPSNGTLSVVGTGFLYTPNTGYSGSDSFMYQIEDETFLLSSSVIVSLNVTPSNTPPVVSDDTFTLNEDNSITQTLSGADPELSTLTYILDTLPTSGTVSLSATGVFTYIPDADFNGSDSFTFHANDAVFDSNIATITLTIDPINDLPTVLSGSYNIQGNSYASSGNIFSGMLFGTDIDSSLLTFTASVMPTHGVLLLTNTGNYVYIPAYGYTGSDSFTYYATDDMGGVSNTGAIIFNITGVNAAPFAVSEAYITNEDTAIVLTLSGSDPDGDAISYIRDTNVATGTLVFLPNGNVTYTPPMNYNGTVSFTYHTFDGQLSSSITGVTIDILPVNDAPSSTPAMYTMSPRTTTNSGLSLTGILLGNDIDSGYLSFTISTLPTNGTVVLDSSGAFTYIPNFDFIGTDIFRFVVSDGSLNSYPSMVTIAIITPQISHSVKQTGPGGAGGSSYYSSSSSSDPGVLSSAPTYQGFTAASDLEGQLLFARLTPSGQILPTIFPNTTGSISTDSSVTGITTTSELVARYLPEIDFADDAAVFLRGLVRMIIGEAEISDDPMTAYDDAIMQIEFMDTEGDERLTLTKEYALRMLQFRQRMYEEMIYRDLSSAPIKSENTAEDNLDNTPEDDLSETDEEIESLLSLLDTEE